MEYGVYNGKLYSAHNIVTDTNIESIIRTASSNKELYCRECGEKVKYRNGEKKIEHFAHTEANPNCLYSNYDSSQGGIKIAKYSLFELLKKQGYDVELEAKILENHYTDLLINLNDKKIAVEFISKQRLPDRIEKLYDEYNHIGIQMQLIIVQKNKRTYEDLELLKMFYTKEYKNQNKFVIHTYDMCVYQYAKIDIDVPKTENGFYYDENFRFTKTLDNITIKDGILTLKDYDDNLKKRQDWILEQYKKHLEWKKESEERIKNINTQNYNISKLENTKTNNVFYAFSNNNIRISNNNYQKITTFTTQNIKKINKQKETKLSYEERKKEIENIINQSNEVAYDSSGIRWVKCQECEKIDEIDNFASYGGDNINSGICKECSRK